MMTTLTPIQINNLLISDSFKNLLDMELSRAIELSLSISMDVDTLLQALGKQYINNCGISAGYRTIIWDMMVAVVVFYKKKDSIEDLDEICDDLNEMLDTIDENHRNFDILIILLEEEAEVIVDYLSNIPTSEQLYVTHGLFCFMSVYFMSED